MSKEVLVSPSPATDTDDCTLADIEACTGVVADLTGDYAAGRTMFFETGEKFLEFLGARVHESD